MSTKDGITVTVYGLSSSEDDVVRYVGQTTGPLNQRLIHHHYDAQKLSTIHKSNWIRSVITRGYSIRIIPIEENAPWGTAEIKWIKFYRDAGLDLVNTTDGGEGVVGYIRDAEWRARRSASMKGRQSPRKGVKLSDETREKISVAQKGKVISAQTREKISAALKGRKKSSEHIAKVAAANRKPEQPPPTLEELVRRKAQRSANCSEWQKGRILPEEHKAKIAAGLSMAYANGRRGPMSKLTDDQVRQIRHLLLQPGVKQKDIAAQFKVSAAAISEINHNKSYRHVK